MVDTSAPARVAVLGATGAVGQTVARLLHAQGSQLVLLARDAERLGLLASELGAAHQTLTDAAPGTIREALTAACGDGPLTGVAHCIGR